MKGGLRKFHFSSSINRGCPWSSYGAQCSMRAYAQREECAWSTFIIRNLHFLNSRCCKCISPTVSIIGNRFLRCRACACMMGITVLYQLVGGFCNAKLPFSRMLIWQCSQILLIHWAYLQLLSTYIYETGRSTERPSSGKVKNPDSTSPESPSHRGVCSRAELLRTSLVVSSSLLPPWSQNYIQASFG